MDKYSVDCYLKKNMSCKNVKGDIYFSSEREAKAAEGVVSEQER